MQTTITVTVLTYHNGDTPVRTETRTMVYPDYTGGLPAAGNPEGAIDDSWYVTQIVTVDAGRNVTIGGLGPLMPHVPGATAARRVPGWNPPRKPEGRRP